MNVDVYVRSLLKVQILGDISRAGWILNDAMPYTMYVRSLLKVEKFRGHQPC